MLARQTNYFKQIVQVLQHKGLLASAMTTYKAA
jgi:hypothetical protein